MELQFSSVSGLGLFSLNRSRISILFLCSLLTSKPVFAVYEKGPTSGRALILEFLYYALVTRARSMAGFLLSADEPELSCR